MNNFFQETGFAIMIVFILIGFVSVMDKTNNWFNEVSEKTKATASLKYFFKYFTIVVVILIFIASLALGGDYLRNLGCDFVY